MQGRPASDNASRPHVCSDGRGNYVSVCLQSSDLSRRRKENAEEKAELSRKESERSITVKVWF